MTLSIASFAIAAISLIVSVVSLMLGNENNRPVRYGLGFFLLFVTIIFCFIGFFSFVGNSTTSTPNDNGNQPPNSQQIICDQEGYMPPIPQAPPTGCILTVEWWYPPNSSPCGLWITQDSVNLEEGVAGYWWYEHAVTVPGHIDAFKARTANASCEVHDFR